MATRPGTPSVRSVDYAEQTSPMLNGTFNQSAQALQQSKFGYLQIRNVLITQSVDALPMPDLPPTNENLF